MWKRDEMGEGMIYRGVGGEERMVSLVFFLNEVWDDSCSDHQAVHSQTRTHTHLGYGLRCPWLSPFAPIAPTLLPYVDQSES